LIVDIETDKVVLEVLAEADGVLTEIVAAEGETVLSSQLLGRLDTSATATAAPAAAAPAETAASEEAPAPAAGEPILSPAARKIVEENALNAASIQGTGKDGRITKEDALAAVANKSAAPAAATAPAVEPLVAEGDRIEKRVPMTRLRKRVAERLVEAQSSMAMLTTFNEVNMKPIMELRSKYKDLFEKTH